MHGRPLAIALAEEGRGLLFAGHKSSVRFGQALRHQANLLRQIAHGLTECQQFLFFEDVHFFVQQFDFKFGFDIDFIITLRMAAVQLALTVLTHHDGRCGVGGLK